MQRNPLGDSMGNGTEVAQGNDDLRREFADWFDALPESVWINATAPQFRFVAWKAYRAGMERAADNRQNQQRSALTKDAT